MDPRGAWSIKQGSFSDGRCYASRRTTSSASFRHRSWADRCLSRGLCNLPDRRGGHSGQPLFPASCAAGTFVPRESEQTAVRGGVGNGSACALHGNSWFWVAALLLGIVPIPDLYGPLAGMANSLAKMAHWPRRRGARPSGGLRAGAARSDQGGRRSSEQPRPKPIDRPNSAGALTAPAVASTPAAPLAERRPQSDPPARAPIAAARGGVTMELSSCARWSPFFPDFLYRRYGQGKKIGTDITLYSVWFELRYGITACLFLTILLLTLILYFPSIDQQCSVLLPDRADPSRKLQAGSRRSSSASGTR